MTSRRKRKKKRRNGLTSNGKPRPYEFEPLEPRLLLDSHGVDGRWVGEIAAVGEVDRFPLIIKQTEIVSLSLHTRPTRFDSENLNAGRIALIGPAGEVVVENDSSGLFSDAELPNLRLDAGSYEILVAADPDFSDRVGDYELHIADRDPESAGTLAAGDIVTNHLRVRNRLVEYEIPIGAEDFGKQLRFAFEASANGVLRESLNIKVQLIAPSGDPIANLGPTSVGVLPWTPLSLEQGGQGEGTYRLRVEPSHSSQTGLVKVAFYDGVAVAEPLSDFEFVAGSLSHIGEQKSHAFEASAGETIRFWKRIGVNQDMSLRVVNPSGESHELLVRGGEYQEFPILADGEYKVIVDSLSSNAFITGPYLLGFDATSPAGLASGIPEIHFGESIAADVSTPGKPLRFRLNVAESDVGNPVTIYAVNPGLSPFVKRLIRPNGDVAIETGNRESILQDFVIDEQGQWQIEVEPTSSTGLLEVTVSDQRDLVRRDVEVGERIIHHFSGYGDVHAYQFIASSAEELTIDNSSVSTSDARYEYTVYDSNGEVVARGGTSGIGGVQRTVTFATVAGETYRMTVHRWPAQRESDSYSFSLTRSGQAAVPRTFEGEVTGLTHGQSVMGILQVPGDVKEYRFDGTRGDTVSFALSGGLVGPFGGQAVLRVRAPGGTTIFESPSAGSHRVHDVTLPVDGSYILEVVAQGETTGVYELSFSKRSAVEEASTPLVSGAKLSGSLATSADEDFYSFEYSAGETVWLSAGSARQTEPLQLSLIAPNGQILYESSGDRSPFTDPSLGPIRLPLEGTYQVRIRAMVDRTILPTASTYQLEFQAHATVPQVAPLALGESQINTWFAGQQPQSFDVELSAGDQLNVSVRTLSISTLAHDTMDSSLTVISPSGAVLADIEEGVNSTLSQLLVSESGTYRLQIGGRGIGMFEIAADVAPRAVSRPLTFTDGLPVTAYLDSPTQVHRYTVSIDDPVAARIQVFDLDANRTLRAVLRNDLGHIVADGTVINRQLELETSQLFGNYVLEVMRELREEEIDNRTNAAEVTQPIEPGGYALQFERIDVESQLVVVHDGAIGFGEQQTVVIDTIGEDYQLALDVSEEQLGQLVSVTVANLGTESGQAAVVELYAPDGSLLRSSDSSNFRHAVQIRDYPLSVFGQYTIRIHDYQWDQTSEFIVGVSDQATEASQLLGVFNQAVSGEIEYVGDVDAWTFDAVAGQTIVATIPDHPGGDPIGALTILDPTGNPISNGLSKLGFSNAPILTQPTILPAEGSYTVIVRTPGRTPDFALGETFPYDLTVYSPDSDSVPIAVEFNEAVAVSVHRLGGRVRRSFDVTADQVGRPVTITVGTRPQNPTGQFYAVAELRDPAGNVVGSTEGNFSTALQFENYRLPVAGRYTLDVYDGGPTNRAIVADHDALAEFSIGISGQPLQSLDEPIVIDAEAIPRAIDFVGDVDQYTFDAEPGQQFRVIVDSATFNVSLSTEVVDENGNRVAYQAGNPDATIDRFVTVSGGQYTLRVKTIGGNGGTFNLDGTTDYTVRLRDIGSYADLVASNVTATPDPAFGDLTADGPARITVSWEVTNQGTGPGPSDRWVDAIIASDDDTLGNSDDRVLATFPHRGLLEAQADGLDPSQYSYTRSETFAVPIGTHSRVLPYEGRVHLFVQTDFEEAIYENGFKDNNVAHRNDDLAETFDITRGQYSDLIVTGFDVPEFAQSGQPTTVSWEVTNASANNSDGHHGHALSATDRESWIDRVYVVRDGDLANFDQRDNEVFRKDFVRAGGLGLDASYARQGDITLPDRLMGTFYLVVETNAPTNFRTPYEFIFGPQLDGRFAENNNRVISGPIDVGLRPLPNLSVASPSAVSPGNDPLPSDAIIAPDTPVAAGSVIDITWTEHNRGAVPVDRPWTTEVWLRRVVAEGEPAERSLLGRFRQTDLLSVDQSITRTEPFRLPANRSGVFQVEIVVDRDSARQYFGTKRRRQRDA